MKPAESAQHANGHRAFYDGAGLIALLLDEQQQLTAVEEFARVHTDGVHALEGRYSKLLPATPPGDGQQYAFEVDLDRCSGCKACVTACHSLNGLDEFETWRDVGLLIGGTSSNPVMQHVTTACHHCLEPACMIACPVDAYEKDATTGIVTHLNDQCIGCQYCTLACPYDVPKYHAGKGIVRKCDLCSDRLAVGEAPACVQACPHEAIAIRLVDRLQVIEDAETDHFLPAAPDPQMTLPTTHFKSKRVFPRNTLPADYYSVNPQQPHWPLIVMLVLTELSVGAFLVGMFLNSRLESPTFRQLHALSALGFGLLAIVASITHLGRPKYSVRAFLGLRHSWLSREIVAFGMFAGSACLYALVCSIPSWQRLVSTFEWTVAASGLLGLYCSAMVYAFTRREFWSLGRTLTKFTLTAAVLGIAATWLSILVFGIFIDRTTANQLAQNAGTPLVIALIVAAAAKLLFEATLLRHLPARRRTVLKRSAELLVGPLSSSTFARFACGLLGGIVMPAFLWQELSAEKYRGLFLLISVGMIFVACIVGELLERYQFFAACAVPRMPGRL